MAKISIDEAEYIVLVEKATKYDKLSAANRLNGQKSAASLTAEQRSERAKKAVAARIKKYGQKKGN